MSDTHWKYEGRYVGLARSVDNLLPTAAREARRAGPIGKTTCPSCAGRKSPDAAMCRSCKQREWMAGQRAKRRNRAPAPVGPYKRLPEIS